MPVSPASCRSNTEHRREEHSQDTSRERSTYHRVKEDYLMTRDEVEALITTKTHNNKLRIHHLEEREGGSVAFLSYSFDDQNKMTIWHTEVPQQLQHKGIGGKLVEEAVQIASRDSSRLRIVCSFAKEHLARHPELKERYAVAAQASIADNQSLSDGQNVAGE
jgi:predicted GNAT family acetyltransferase